MPIPLNDLRRVNAPHSAALEAAFARVVGRGAFVLGDEVVSFEREFAAYCGTGHAVGVANGTDALELALRALGVGAGDQVATVANAAMYATTAIRSTGARPRYVDIDEADLLMSPAALDARLDPAVRAIVVTHLYGRLAPMNEILDIAARRGVPVIEDCAQAHGAVRDGVRAGAFGAAGCFSFYPTKNLGALGDGGAVVTSDTGLAARVRSLRQYGWGAKYRVEHEGGRNSRLDELQAAFLRARLPSLDAENALRRAIVDAYRCGIAHPAIRTPSAAGPDCVAHLAVVRSPHRDALRDHLVSRGIGCDVHYPLPDHRQPGGGDARPAPLPATERACAEVLTLPCFPGLSDAEVSAVVDACNAWTP
jgi:dTDP-4-amino-4,6-dideoxygalactose transaminase